jgi:D-glycerate 3-kinase
MPALADALAPRILAAARVKTPLVVGLTGPQGSGKTTVAEGLRRRLTRRGLRVGVLSIDDLYLPAAERPRLPLLGVRGVPGTHDPALGVRIVEALKRRGRVRIPVFDKAADDRAADWRTLAGPKDVILFEGWCVAARPEPDAALARPANAVEQRQDPDGIGRRYINARLADDYAELFALIDFQIVMLAPDFDVVTHWRQQQEVDLRSRTGRGQSNAWIADFVLHYERLTRHIAAEMPPRADVTVRLGPGREVLAVSASVAVV